MNNQDDKPDAGDQVEVEFPDGWRSGFTVVKRCGAIDRDYRYIVEGDADCYRYDGIAPECVRHAKSND